MNICAFTGRLTKDIEIMELNNKKKTKMTIYTVAIQDDFNKEKVYFLSFQSFGKVAEYLNKYGKKGMYIEVGAKATTYTKDDKTNTIFVTNSVNLIFANSKSNNQESTTPKPKETVKENYNNEPAENYNNINEDAPF